MRIRDSALLSVVMSLLIFAVAVWAVESAGQATPKVSFSGKVLDDQGRPISDARVALYEVNYGGGDTLPKAECVQEIATGPDGAFVFTRAKESQAFRQGSIIVQKERFALGWVAWEMQEADEQADITLGEPKELAGSVVDEGGAPIVDAEVCVAIAIIGSEQDRRYITYLVAPQLLTVRTDSSGRFVFPNLPGAATCEILAKKPGRATTCTFDAASYRGEKCQLSPGQEGIKLTLTAEARIEGMVIEKAGGKPVAGVQLIAQPTRRGLPFAVEPVTSDQDGTFFVGNLSSDTYTLQLASQREGPAEWVAEPAKVDLKAGETARDVRLALSKGAFVEVLVKEATGGKPVDKANVSVRDETNNRWLSGVTDEAGLARIRLPAGSYQLSGIYKEGYARSEQSEPFTIAEGETKRFEQMLSSLPSLSGTVYDDAGKPLEGVAVQIVPGGRGKNATSDAEGKFTVTWDTQGWSSDRTVFYLVARHVDRNLAIAQPVEEGGGPADVKLRPAATLTGQVVDPNGKGIEGAMLQIMLRASNWGASFLPYRSVKTDGEGRFQVGAIPAEQRYDIVASAEGYGQMRIDVTEDRVVSDRVRTGTFSLPLANLSVSGVVVDSEGEPVSGARVSCYGGSQDNQPNRDTQTNAEGKFTLDHVCAGRIRIQANAQVQGSYIYGSIETEGGAKDVQITVAERSSGTRYVPRSPTKLAGKHLPDLKKLGIKLPADANDRMLLVCFWDMNQRPSRHCISELVRQAEALVAKGVQIVAVQAGKTEEGALEQWMEQSKPSFPVGRITGDVEKTLFEWGTVSLPHLILTDRKRVVVGEGFALLGELDTRIEAVSGR